MLNHIWVDEIQYAKCSCKYILIVTIITNYYFISDTLFMHKLFSILDLIGAKNLLVYMM